MNIQQTITSSYHHQNNGHVEACIKFIKCTIRKYLDDNDNINLGLLQMGSKPIGTGLPSPAILLFNRPVRVLLPQICVEPININADDEHCKALKTNQDKYPKGIDTCKDSFSFPIESRVAVQCEDAEPWTHTIVEEVNGTEHHGQSYIIQVMKTDRLIMCNISHICITPISREQYFQE